MYQSEKYFVNLCLLYYFHLRKVLPTSISKNNISLISDKPRIKIYHTVPISQTPCIVQLYCEVLATPEAEITWSEGINMPLIIASTARLANQIFSYLFLTYAAVIHYFDWSATRRQLVTLNAGTTKFLVVAFQPLQQADLNKRYTCVASNSLGVAKQDFTLNGESCCLS